MPQPCGSSTPICPNRYKIKCISVHFSSEEHANLYVKQDFNPACMLVVYFLYILIYGVEFV